MWYQSKKSYTNIWTSIHFQVLNYCSKQIARHWVVNFVNFLINEIILLTNSEARFHISDTARKQRFVTYLLWVTSGLICVLFTVHESTVWYNFADFANTGPFIFEVDRQIGIMTSTQYMKMLRNFLCPHWISSICILSKLTHYGGGPTLVCYFTRSRCTVRDSTSRRVV